jgi:exo-beta-1,3-glucanase (GH17 family)
MERVIKLTEIIKNITVINYIQSVIHFVSMLTPYINKITVDHQWNFNITNQTLITYSAFIRYWRKIGSTMGEYVSHL